jgi:hypothetical protein
MQTVVTTEHGVAPGSAVVGEPHERPATPPRAPTPPPLAPFVHNLSDPRPALASDQTLNFLAEHRPDALDAYQTAIATLDRSHVAGVDAIKSGTNPSADCMRVIDNAQARRAVYVQNAQGVARILAVPFEVPDPPPGLLFADLLRAGIRGDLRGQLASDQVSANKRLRGIEAELNECMRFANDPAWVARIAQGPSLGWVEAKRFQDIGEQLRDMYRQWSGDSTSAIAVGPMNALLVKVLADAVALRIQPLADSHRPRWWLDALVDHLNDVFARQRHAVDELARCESLTRQTTALVETSVTRAIDSAGGPSAVIEQLVDAMALTRKYPPELASHKAAVEALESRRHECEREQEQLTAMGRDSGLAFDDTQTKLAKLTDEIIATRTALIEASRAHATSIVERALAGDEPGRQQLQAAVDAAPHLFPKGFGQAIAAARFHPGSVLK